MIIMVREGEIQAENYRYFRSIVTEDRDTKWRLKKNFLN